MVVRDPAMALFAVIRSRGPAWNWLLPMRRQDDWAAHAAYMDALADDGFILAAGPLGGEDDAPRVLYLIDAADPTAVEAGLDADPWTPHRLATLSIEPWTVLVGSLPSRGTTRAQ